MVDMKAEALSETLRNLPDNKIKPFFRYVRENLDQMPNDGTLKKLLQTTYKKFTNYQDTTQIEDNGGAVPSQEWRENFTANVNAVINGTLTPEQAKANLGLV